MPLPVAHSLIGASVATAVQGKTESRWKLFCTTSYWDVAVDALLISLAELIMFCPLLLLVMLLRIMSIRKGKLLHGMDH